MHNLNYVTLILWKTFFFKVYLNYVTIVVLGVFIKHQAQQVISIVMKNIVDGYVYNIS